VVRITEKNQNKLTLKHKFKFKIKLYDKYIL